MGGLRAEHLPDSKATLFEQSHTSTVLELVLLLHRLPKTPSSKVREAFALLELGSRQGSDPSVAQMAGKGPKAEDAEVGPSSLRRYLG